MTANQEGTCEAAPRSSQLPNQSQAVTATTTEFTPLDRVEDPRAQLLAKQASTDANSQVTPGQLKGSQSHINDDLTRLQSKEASPPQRNTLWWNTLYKEIDDMPQYQLVGFQLDEQANLDKIQASIPSIPNNLAGYSICVGPLPEELATPDRSQTLTRLPDYGISIEIAEEWKRQYNSQEDPIMDDEKFWKLIIEIAEWTPTSAKRTENIRWRIENCISGKRSIKDAEQPLRKRPSSRKRRSSRKFVKPYFGVKTKDVETKSVKIKRVKAKGVETERMEIDGIETGGRNTRRSHRIAVLRGNA
jgi:hypothetical protein